jgi:hypothetical protein
MMSGCAQERGSALIAVLLLVFVATAFASLAQGRVRNLARDTLRDRGHAEALYAAEGGLAKARHALRIDPLWSGDHLQVGASEVVVRVVRAAPDQWRISSQATAHPGGQDSNPVRVAIEEELGSRYRYRAER